MRKTLLLLFSLTPLLSFSQNESTADLFQMLYEKDSLLFNLGFNTCDTSQFHALLSEEAEFYHDQSGILKTKAAFVNNIKEGICKMENKPRRALVKESLNVYPLKRFGELYGAIQTGKHQFFLKPDGTTERMTSEALFTHLWLLEDGEWKLARILSFDHQAP